MAKRFLAGGSSIGRINLTTPRLLHQVSYDDRTVPESKPPPPLAPCARYRARISFLQNEAKNSEKAHAGRDDVTRPTPFSGANIARRPVVALEAVFPISRGHGGPTPVDIAPCIGN